MSKYTNHRAYDRVSTVYIKGHGNTDAEYLCFLPPIFTKISMAENYGKTLVTNVANPLACKQVKEPVFGLINDLVISFVGIIVSLDEKHNNNMALNLLFQNTGVGLVDRHGIVNNEWINNTRMHKLFGFSLLSDNADNYTNLEYNALRYLNFMEIQKVFYDSTNAAGDPKFIIYIKLDVPVNITTYDRLLDTDSIDELIAEKMKKTTTLELNSDEVTEKTQLFNKAETELNREDIVFVNTVHFLNRLTDIYFDIMKLPKITANRNSLENLYILFKHAYISEQASKLLLNKVIHINLSPSKETNDNIVKYFESQNFTVALSDIICNTKSELIESRLLDFKKGLVLRCETCRNLPEIDERTKQYSEVKDILNPTHHIPKTVTKYAANNLKSGDELGKFKGRVPPHIVVNSILFPCFLFLTHATEMPREIYDLFISMIKDLFNYKIKKTTLLKFISLVTPKYVQSMILKTIVFNKSETTAEYYGRMINTLLFILCGPDKHLGVSYTIEEVILIFGVIINNLTTFIDIPGLAFRDLLDIQPREYDKHHKTGQPSVNAQGANNNIPKFTLFNNNPMYQNNTPSRAHGTHVNERSKLSKKQRKQVNRLAKRTFKELVFNKNPAGGIITKEYIQQITAHLAIVNNYPCLSSLVASNPNLHLIQLLQLSEWYQV